MGLQYSGSLAQKPQDAGAAQGSDETLWVLTEWDSMFEPVDSEGRPYPRQAGHVLCAIRLATVQPAREGWVPIRIGGQTLFASLEPDVDPDARHEGLKGLSPREILRFLSDPDLPRNAIFPHQHMVERAAERSETP